MNQSIAAQYNIATSDQRMLTKHNGLEGEFQALFVFMV